MYFRSLSGKARLSNTHTDKERGTTTGIQESRILEKTLRGFVVRHVCIDSASTTIK